MNEKKLNRYIVHTVYTNLALTACENNNNNNTFKYLQNLNNVKK